MRLLSDESKNNVEEAEHIKAQMERECQRKMWYFINRSEKDPQCGAFHIVQRWEDETTVESCNQEDPEDFIFEETDYRFQIIAEAPISKTNSSTSWDTWENPK